MNDSLPTTMRAAVLTGHGGLERIELHDDWPVPRAGPGEVLIRVAACGMNNTDINTRTAWYAKAVTEGTTATGGRDGFGAIAHDSDDDVTGAWGGSVIRFPLIQGADLCGHVVAVGDGAAQALLGERVLVDPWLRDPDHPLDLTRARFLGSEHDGGYAEFACVPACNAHPIRSPLSDAELATFATSWITAENMLQRAAVGDGDTVLIPGASGGVGSALVQLARRRGASAVALCSEAKSEQVRGLGATAVLPREPDDLAAALSAATGARTVSVVADVVGGALWPQLIDVLERGGRYTCAGAIAGPIVELDLRTFYLNDLTFTGATIVAPGLFAHLVGYIERGEVTPVLARTWALDQIRDAQSAFLDKSHIGNFVITI